MAYIRTFQIKEKGNKNSTRTTKARGLTEAIHKFIYDYGTLEYDLHWTRGKAWADVLVNSDKKYIIREINREKIKSAILSIKPEYAEKIYSGEKLYEYRKRPPRDIETIYLYESSPIKKVTGQADIEKIIEDIPEKLWKETKEKGGISKENYDTYFKKSAKAYAIVLKNIKKYETPKKLEDFGIKEAPQSWQYLK